MQLAVQAISHCSRLPRIALRLYRQRRRRALSLYRQRRSALSRAFLGKCCRVPSLCWQRCVRYCHVLEGGSVNVGCSLSSGRKPESNTAAGSGTKLIFLNQYCSGLWHKTHILKSVLMWAVRAGSFQHSAYDSTGTGLDIDSEGGRLTMTLNL